MRIKFNNVIISPEKFEKMIDSGLIIDGYLEVNSNLSMDKTDPVNQVQELVDKGANLDNYVWEKYWWKRKGMGVKLVPITHVDVSGNTASKVMTYDEKEIPVGDTIEYYTEVGLDSRWYVCLVGNGYELINPVFKPGHKLDEGINYATFLSDFTYDPSKTHRREYEA